MAAESTISSAGFTGVFPYWAGESGRDVGLSLAGRVACFTRERAGTGVEVLPSASKMLLFGCGESRSGVR